LFCKFRVFLRTENNLRQAFAIAKIDKNNAAMIAQNMDPAGERDPLADVAFAKLIAVMRSRHEIQKEKRVILSEAKNLSSYH
jgi:hypothetical protein